MEQIPHIHAFFNEVQEMDNLPQILHLDWQYKILFYSNISGRNIFIKAKIKMLMIVYWILQFFMVITYIQVLENSLKETFSTPSSFQLLNL